MCKYSDQRKIPPDGGYGWIVTFAYALKNIVTISVVFNFGLVLQEGYDDMNISPSAGNLAIVLRQTIEMLLSLFGGPLLHRWGYRKVAIVGSLLVFVGLSLTSTASNVWQLILYFSIIFSIGNAALVAAFALAVNSFFKTKRARALGIVAFASGIGPICMPLFMSNLLYSYGWRYTVLTLSALSLHSFLSACLLRPVKWYSKIKPTTEVQQERVILHIKSNVQSPTAESGKATPIQNEAFEEGNRLLRSLSVKCLKSNTTVLQNNATVCHNTISKLQEAPLLQLKNAQEPKEQNNFTDIMINESQNKRKHETKNRKNKSNGNKKYIYNIIDFFDLTLLRDPAFVNILCGLSVAPCAEVSFSLLLPAILKDMMKLETSDIAKLISVIAFSDVIFRLLGPFITEPWNKSPRVIYMVSLSAGILAKSAMLFTKSFHGMIYVALAIGVSKGISSVYLKVIIPNHVPLHRLAFAMGIQRFFRGITMISIGSILLRIRDATGSYHVSIVILNVFTLITILLWTAEFVYLKLKKIVPEDDKSYDS